MDSFSVYHRGPGHWDIYSKTARMFCIRGMPGSWMIYDERKDKFSPETYGPFSSHSDVMMYICKELMFEEGVTEWEEVSKSKSTTSNSKESSGLTVYPI